MTPLLTQLHTRIAELVPESAVLCMNPDLADVLRAMNNLDKEKNYNAFGLAVAMNGMFFKDREPLCQWDTSKNLDGQSPEVHAFIGKIMRHD